MMVSLAHLPNASTDFATVSIAQTAVSVMMSIGEIV
jgi:hypothetical protein